MTFKLNKLVAAMAVLASVGAQAAIFQPPENLGNGSVIFVAMDLNSNAGFIADTGLTMNAFTGGFTGGPTMLTPGTTTWNFGTDSTTLATTGNSWAGAYSLFKGAQAGNDLVWAVLAGDNVNVAAANGTTNTIAGRGLLATGNPTQTQINAASTSTPTGNALANLNTFMAASETVSGAGYVNTIVSSANGAVNTDSTRTNAWLNISTMQGTFGGQLTWNYLVGNGATSAFNFQQQIAANPVVNQFGFPANSVDAPQALPLSASFSFDVNTDTLVWSVANPVPEPGTYAMLMAGLAAVGFVARRRRQAA